MKTAILIFTLVLSAASNAAVGKNYCIRLYCDKLARTKILNNNEETPHGKFVPAHYDWKSNVYIIDKDNFEAAQNDCEHRFGRRPEKLFGKNAAMLESAALWVVVTKTSGDPSLQNAEKCEAMERK